MFWLPDGQWLIHRIPRDNALVRWYQIPALHSPSLDFFLPLSSTDNAFTLDRALYISPHFPPLISFSISEHQLPPSLALREALTANSSLLRTIYKLHIDPTSPYI